MEDNVKVLQVGTSDSHNQLREDDEIVDSSFTWTDGTPCILIIFPSVMEEPTAFIFIVLRIA